MDDPLTGANCSLCGATADNFRVSDGLWAQVGLGDVQACFKCFRIAAWHSGVRPDPWWVLLSDNVVPFAALQAEQKERQRVERLHDELSRQLTQAGERFDRRTDELDEAVKALRFYAAGVSQDPPHPATAAHGYHDGGKLARETLASIEATGVDELERFLARVRGVALECGYAIGVHGSLRRDLDLIAAPWTPEAVSAQQLVDELCERVPLHPRDVNLYGDEHPWRMEPNPEMKPWGRLGWSLGGCPTHQYVDLSVMPRAGEAVPAFIAQGYRDAERKYLARNAELQAERDAESEAPS